MAEFYSSHSQHSPMNRARIPNRLGKHPSPSLAAVRGVSVRRKSPPLCEQECLHRSNTSLYDLSAKVNDKRVAGKDLTIMEQKFDLEGLRPTEYVHEPDPRSTMFVRIDRTNGTSRPIELADHHEQISAYGLHAGVPQEIVLQFETARNVYVYAWFVYRFYPVAEHLSLACLELALRERLKEEMRTGKIKSKRPTLYPLLKYAVDHGLVKNEGF